MAGKIGATVAAPGADTAAIWFGEDQGRYLLTASAEKTEQVCELARQAGVAIRILGEIGGDTLRLGAAQPVLVRELLDAHENWMPTYMAGGGKSV